MRLMPLSEAPVDRRLAEFRHSPGRAVGAVAGIAAAIAGLLILGRVQGSGFYDYLAGVLLLGTLVMWNFVFARFRSSNWLARTSDEGLFLQFRSYLNFRLPETDQTVVFIPYREIRSVSLVEEIGEAPQRDPDSAFGERSTERRRRLIEIEVSGDTSQLAAALAEERTKRSPNGTLYRDHPVRLRSPACLQVAWTVVPRAQVFLDALRRRTRVPAPVERRVDYAALDGLSRNEQEARLRDLIAAGQTIDAVYIARKLYAYDLAQARAFVEGLRDGGSPR